MAVSQKLAHKIITQWISNGASVLDLGCGDGTLLSELVNEKDVHGQGIELSDKDVSQCVALGLNVYQQDIDTGLSEYACKSFDYVILNQTLQQIKKPDFVLKEALRVGSKVIVGFPNFVHINARLQISFKGQVPVTPALPYQWYDTPNLHFLGINDFKSHCQKNHLKIEKAACIRGKHQIHWHPNLLAELGLFLLSR